MRPRRALLAALVVAAAAALVPAGAAAEPNEVEVRIEGRSETLFEGPILTEGHNVKATGSDSLAPAVGRPCDGTNAGRGTVPAPTPTAAAADAMALEGQTFDGIWYPGYDDYFITRFGPDAEDAARTESWGVIVNNVFTPVGGCQQRLEEGDEVLWAFDAFRGRPRLALYPAGFAGGPVPLTAEAELRQPFELDVDQWTGSAEGSVPTRAARSEDPYAGARIVAMAAGPSGFEAPDPGNAPATSDADGRVELAFAQPGWYRVKAIAPGAPGKETAIRSNRIDICVPPGLTSGCGAVPADDLPRVPPPPAFDSEEEAAPEGVAPAAPTGGGEVPPAAAAKPAAAAPPQLDLQVPRLDRTRLRRGIVVVRWRVLDPGAGIAGWKVAARDLSRPGARFATVASGTTASSARIRLRPGAGYRLRFSVTDALGSTATIPIGRVRVPPLSGSRGRATP
jgi:hypothetical protein